MQLSTFLHILTWQVNVHHRRCWLIDFQHIIDNIHHCWEFSPFNWYIFFEKFSAYNWYIFSGKCFWIYHLHLFVEVTYPFNSSVKASKSKKSGSSEEKNMVWWSKRVLTFISFAVHTSTSEGFVCLQLFMFSIWGDLLEHFSVLLLTLIRQEEGFVAKCQDIGMGNPPSVREGKGGLPTPLLYFFTSTLLYIQFSMFLLGCVVKRKRPTS